ncbi:MAG TPA: helix-turn-helix transcriptional regulator [Terriglobales bacterium]|nr:helix-turn-helix transcriptional regulator [Terriglobales bacterium]
MAKMNSRVTASSGNVFADIGLPGAEERKTKVQLAVALNHIIESLGLSQGAAARALRVNQPKISALANYRLEGFSVERLMNFLNALGHDIEIVIHKSRPRKEPGIRVTAA